MMEPEVDSLLPHAVTVMPPNSANLNPTSPSRQSVRRRSGAGRPGPRLGGVEVDCYWQWDYYESTTLRQQSTVNCRGRKAVLYCDSESTRANDSERSDGSPTTITLFRKLWHLLLKHRWQATDLEHVTLETAR
jgi:hypothetical protein